MKILYLGNSITLHGVNHDIGWHGEWGMAASAAEKDYVHCLNRMLEETGAAVEYKVRNIADFERNPDTFDLENFAELRTWEPDVLILRICENTPEEKADAFGEAYLRLIRYFQIAGIHIYAVGPFWKHDKKEAYIRKSGELTGVTYVSLQHLHSQEYQAIGLFEHPGVAGHPSDRGMQAIADAIFEAINKHGANTWFYPFIKPEPSSDRYAVQVGHKHKIKVPCYVCRVSAMPFNRVWPGQQRPLEQTEKAYFTAFAMAVPQEITVTMSRDFREAVLRPLSKKIPLKIDGRTITFTLPEPGQYSLEIDGRHGNLHIFADPMDDPEKERQRMNRATYYYGPGIHDAGMITLQDGESLYIAEGAVVHGMVSAVDSENIGIYGHGILDQSKYERDSCRKGVQNGIIRMTRCKNIEIEGIILRDSSAWTMTLINCDGVECRNLKAIGMWRYNADGFDFCNCRNVHVTGCFLRNFDDVIVLKGLRTGEPSAELWNPENILVENCVLWCDWGGALEIGAETVADEYRDITFRNIDIIRNDSGAMRIQSGDRAEVHHVLYEDIRVEYSKYDRASVYQQSDDMVYAPPEEFCVPDVIRVWMYCNMWTKDGILGHVHDITCRNIQVLTDAEMPMPACSFYGAEEKHRVEGVTIDGFTWNGVKTEPVIRTNAFAGNIETK
ncbi:MAG: hypothetical protein IJ480_05700 [Clostridia bacterium]|nr:hypothetical protein [Clostridia bacterium]